MPGLMVSHEISTETVLFVRPRAIQGVPGTRSVSGLVRAIQAVRTDDRARFRKKKPIRETRSQ